MPFDPNKLKAFIKAGGKTTGQQSLVARTGGKGSVRRKRKIVRKQTAHDDKRLKSTLNKLNVRDIPAIEEVNLFKDDGTVIHFASPKVQASIASNTYVVSGNAETKKLQELLPGIINQLGPDNLEDLKKIYASYTPPTGGKATEDDDDDIPALVSNFEDQSNIQPAGKETKGDSEVEDKDKKADKKADTKEKPPTPKETKETPVSAPKDKEQDKEKPKAKPAAKPDEEEGDEEEDEEEGDEEDDGKEDVPDLVDS